MNGIDLISFGDGASVKSLEINGLGTHVLLPVTDKDKYRGSISDKSTE